MRPISILTAILVVAALYVFVFEREAALQFARGGGAADEVVQVEEGDADGGAKDVVAEVEAAPEDRRVSIVALRSEADTIDNAVVLRGRTEAARQVDVRAETSGQVISEPLRKGAFVETGTLMCELDPGTREIALIESTARMVEAQASLPSAVARQAEAKARLTEAEINDNAAARLSEGGFASETRVASSRAGLEAAAAGVTAAAAGVTSAEASIRSAEAGIAGAERELERLEITAPFAGILESDAAESGSLLQPGSLCATIIQLDPIKLVGFVPETHVDRVAIGADAAARLTSGREVVGKVTFLSRSADPDTRTFRVDVEVPNADLSIRDGMTAEIFIRSDGEIAHLLPQSSLTLNNEGILGVRLVKDEAAAFSPVTVLRDTAQGVWVAGLDKTAEVIIVGQEYVTDGVSVAVTYQEVTQ